MAEVNTWECIITRRLQINRKEMKFSDYTDWVSAPGRINPIAWGDYILTVTNEPIETASHEYLELTRL